MSRRPLRPEEARLWALVARTVLRAPGVRELAAPDPEPDPEPRPHLPHPPRPQRLRASPEALAALSAAGVGREARALAGPVRGNAASSPISGPAPIEPNRKRRIARAREPIGARLDLHGHDQDRARAALHAFIAHAHADGARAVLVITGKGRMGGGVLRERAPEWLAEPPSRARVAGVSPAEARHGGEGALYVALKPRTE